MAATKVPVFISFDYDHDDDLKLLLVGQAKHDDSPFSIEDWSIKEPSSDWKEKARTRIKRVDQVIVMCGKHTDTATGVNAEIGIARDEKKQYFLLAQPSTIPRAWTGALVLLAMVLVLFVAARLIGGQGPGHVSRFRRLRLSRKGLA